MHVRTDFRHSCRLKFPRGLAFKRCPFSFKWIWRIFSSQETQEASCSSGRLLRSNGFLQICQAKYPRGPKFEQTTSSFEWSWYSQPKIGKVLCSNGSHGCSNRSCSWCSFRRHERSNGRRKDFMGDNPKRKNYLYGFLSYALGSLIDTTAVDLREYFFFCRFSQSSMCWQIIN